MACGPAKQRMQQHARSQEPGAKESGLVEGFKPACPRVPTFGTGSYCPVPTLVSPPSWEITLRSVFQGSRPLKFAVNTNSLWPSHLKSQIRQDSTQILNTN